MTLTKRARKERMLAKKAVTANYYAVDARVLFPGGDPTRLHICLVNKATGHMIPVTGAETGFQPVILPINWAEDNYKGREYLKPEFIGTWEVVRERRQLRVTEEVEAACDQAMAIATEYEVI